MATDVLYEIAEFQRSVAALGSIDKTNEAWNRTLESVLLHFRVLRGFFIDPPQETDVSAREYQNYMMVEWSPVEDPIFSTTEIPLNKKLAHLTWNRLPRSPGNWDIAAMKAAIERLFEDFKKFLTVPAAEWFAPKALIARGLSASDGNWSTVSEPELIDLNVEHPATFRVKTT
jgi:hypothetical protein